ncbi:MAG TPA: hypothetical protein VKW06_13760 [Candidatus Angelobacter sp.]|nr:hypothetical protein [Candidatus Angelobacter sp.]
MLGRRDQLKSQVAAHNSKCTNVPAGSAAEGTCRGEQGELNSQVSSYAAAVREFNSQVEAAKSSCTSERQYKPSGNGFVGGTTWIAGFNVGKADPALIAKSHQLLKQQMELAGLPYGSGIDFERYNFVIGIGASTGKFTDLRKRVVFDEFSRGQFSREHQELYDSLKGRQFDELACHSNGAMVCLAALANKDIKAGRVALYGPQLTRESIQMWDELIRNHQVESVHVYINQNDPVPPFSIAFGDLFLNARADVALLKLTTLDRIINEEGSHLLVRNFSCGEGTPTLACHDMAVYKSNRGCVARPAGGTVPGTALPGKGRLAEPPPPC